MGDSNRHPGALAPHGARESLRVERHARQQETVAHAANGHIVLPPGKADQPNWLGLFAATGGNAAAPRGEGLAVDVKLLRLQAGDFALRAAAHAADWLARGRKLDRQRQDGGTVAWRDKPADVRPGIGRHSLVEKGLHAPPRKVGVPVHEPREVGADLLDLVLGVAHEMHEHDAAPDVEEGQQKQEEHRGRKRIATANGMYCARKRALPLHVYRTAV